MSSHSSSSGTPSSSGRHMSSVSSIPEKLFLTTEEANRLEDLADNVVLDTLDFYDTYRFTEKRVVNPKWWKTVGQRDNLTVFRERSGPRPTYPSIRTADGRMQTIPCKHAPSIKIVGTLQGSLDDEMYGCFIDSDESVRMRSSYVGDSVEKFHWLATIDGPSEADPFRFCGVAHCTIGKALPLVKTRDACVVISMGMTTTRHGERVGYYVVHSVDLSEPPAKNSRRIRAKGSLCWLKTELANGKVDLYMKGFVAPMGYIPELLAFPMLVNLVLGVGQTSDTAYSKKLYWMIHDASKNRSREFPPLDECVGHCKQSFGSSRGANHFHRCIVCRRAVCDRCEVPRKITVDIVEDHATQNRCSVCVLCMNEAKTANPVGFVSREMRAKRAKGMDSRTSFTASSDELAVVPVANATRNFYDTH